MDNRGKLPDFALGDFRRLHDGAVTSGQLPRGVRGIGKLPPGPNNRSPPLFSHRPANKVFPGVSAPCSGEAARRSRLHSQSLKMDPWEIPGDVRPVMEL